MRRKETRGRKDLEVGRQKKYMMFTNLHATRFWCLIFALGDYSAIRESARLLASLGLNTAR